MTTINAFTPQTAEKLKYYVYALVDETTKKICYIGKGIGQRVFGSLQQRSGELKINLTAYIIRHNLSEEESFLVEATLIDFLPYFSISDLPSNNQGGVGNRDFGVTKVEDLELLYSAPIITPEQFEHNVLIVTIDRSIRSNPTPMSENKIYECTRKSWLVSRKSAERVDFIIAKYQGLLFEIYQWEEWYKDPGEPDQRRYAFKGSKVTDPLIRSLYLDKRLDKKSYAPITYIINKEILSAPIKN